MPNIYVHRAVFCVLRIVIQISVTDRSLFFIFIDRSTKKYCMQVKVNKKKYEYIIIYEFKTMRTISFAQRSIVQRYNIIKII